VCTEQREKNNFKYKNSIQTPQKKLMKTRHKHTSKRKIFWGENKQTNNRVVIYKGLLGCPHTHIHTHTLGFESKSVRPKCVNYKIRELFFFLTNKKRNKFNFTKLFENCENSFAHTHTHVQSHHFVRTHFFVVSFCFEFHEIFQTKFLNEKF
jgi:hypothetical protein